MKNTTKKKVIHALSTGLKITAVGAAGLALMGCPPEQEEQKPVPEQQSKTISVPSDGGGVSVVVKYMALPGTTPGYVSNIQQALSWIGEGNSFGLKAGSVTINVISGNSGFVKNGTRTLDVGDGWLSTATDIDIYDALTIDPAFTDNWFTMLNNKKKGQIRGIGGMSPFELAKFQKYGNVRNS